MQLFSNYQPESRNKKSAKRAAPQAQAPTSSSPKKDDILTTSTFFNFFEVFLGPILKSSRPQAPNAHRFPKVHAAAGVGNSAAATSSALASNLARSPTRCGRNGATCSGDSNCGCGRLCMRVTMYACAERAAETRARQCFSRMNASHGTTFFTITSKRCLRRKLPAATNASGWLCVFGQETMEKCAITTK